MIKVKEIKELLKENKDVNDYEITLLKKESSELFFVLKKLELNRATKTETIQIKVYVDLKDKRGSSVVLVTSSDDAKSLKVKIKDAVKKAKTALNPYYPLASKQDSIKKELKIKKTLNEIALETADAMFKADKYKEGWINSTEIFVYKNSLSFYNSKGVKHKEEKLHVDFEIIPTWSKDKEEFELYDYYKSNKFDSKAITKEVKDKLTLAKLRSEAKKIKDVKLPKDLLILTYGEMNDCIVDCLLSNASYYDAYMHSSHYNLKDVISNNKFSLVLKANIDGVSSSSSFDSDGVVLTSKKIIKDGKLISNYGDIKYGHYLNLKKPSGYYGASEIKGECLDYLRKPHLIIDHFSSPQIESSNGYFGGEVRLARYFDGKKYIPLTGLSVSGNIYEALKDISFSKETATTSSYKGPKYFIFKGLKVS